MEKKTFGKGFTFSGSQVHYDKLGHDHWVDLLFFNRILRATVVVELKKASSSPATWASCRTICTLLTTMTAWSEKTLRWVSSYARMQTGPSWSMFCRITTASLRTGEFHLQG